MELIAKSGSNNTTNIGMLPSASKDVSIIFSDQCIHAINKKETLNRLKGSINMKNRWSIFKYQSRISNVQSKSDVNNRGI